MKSTLRPFLAVSAAIALSMTVVIAGPAQAGAYRPVSERTLANSSMTAADVPRWMHRAGAPRVEQFFSNGRDASAPRLCQGGETVDFRFIEGRVSRELMLSRATLREPGRQRAATELTSFIYQYRSREHAVRAWAFLIEQASTCPSFVSDEAVGSGRVQSTVDTQVRSLPRLFGTAGLEIWSDVSFKVSDPTGKLELRGDAFSHYYLAGTSIVQVRHENVDGDSRGVGRVTRGFVESMAIVVAQRVERRSSR